MMKKTILQLAFTLITGTFFVIILSAFMGFNPGGSKGGYSGSPLDGKDCTSCHGGTAVTQAGIITTDIDSAGYIPGIIYNITVSVPGSGLKGFEVSALNASNQIAGILTAGPNTKLVNLSKAVTQSITNGVDPSVWSFKWTAPAKGTGNITFYGAFATGKSKTMLSTLTVKEKQSSSIASESQFQLKIWYEPSDRKLYFESTTVYPQLFSGTIFSFEGKELKQIPEIRLNSGLNTWNADMGGLLIPGFCIIKYSVGNSTASRTIYLY
jgi:hypothetical protein